MPVGAAIGVSGLAGAAANVFAGNQQKQAADKATKVQKDMYAQMRGDLEPYRKAGAEGTNLLMGALPELTSQIKLDQAFLEGTPGYKFARTQGLKAAQSGAAARGLGKSGAAVKGAAQFATGLADQTYQNQFQNEMAQREARYNKLIGTSQLGANAAAQTGQGALTTGQQIGNNLVGGAAAQGAGLIGGANALTGAAGQFAGYNMGTKNMWNPSGGGTGGYRGTVSYSG